MQSVDRRRATGYLRRRARPRERLRALPRVLGAVLLAALATAVLGCATADVDVPRFRAPSSEMLQYLLSPREGFSGQLPAEVALKLDGGYGSLLQGDVASARSAAVELLAASTQLPPARVLLAQADFVDGRVEQAMDALHEVVAEEPEYPAAQLLLARTAELTGDPVTALVSYAAVDLDLAQRRRETLREAALQSALGEVEEALQRGRVDLAEEWREWLASWGEGSPLELRAALAIAEATGDEPAVLEALRGLDGLGVDERPIRQRLAELEAERGDPQAAIDLYSSLLEGHPGDRSLEEGLAAARFRFRMQMLPPRVGGAVSRPELTRGEFASLLYWLVPGVRGSRAQSGIIVTDVPEEAEQRVEIVRVVNLGLMDLANPALRSFEPTRRIVRAAALASLLRVPGHVGVQLACAAPLERTAAPSPARVCEVAASCGLLASVSNCLPQAPASGADVAVWLRQTLELLQ